MIFETGMKVKAITLPDCKRLIAGAPHWMEIYMETGQYCGVPWVRRWCNYTDERFNCATLLSVELERSDSA